MHAPQQLQILLLRFLKMYLRFSRLVTLDGDNKFIYQEKYYSISKMLVKLSAQGKLKFLVFQEEKQTKVSCKSC